MIEIEDDEDLEFSEWHAQGNGIRAGEDYRRWHNPKNPYIQGTREYIFWAIGFNSVSLQSKRLTPLGDWLFRNILSSLPQAFLYQVVIGIGVYWIFFGSLPYGLSAGMFTYFTLPVVFCWFLALDWLVANFVLNKLLIGKRPIMPIE